MQVRIFPREGNTYCSLKWSAAKPREAPLDKGGFGRSRAGTTNYNLSFLRIDKWPVMAYICYMSVCSYIKVYYQEEQPMPHKIYLIDHLDCANCAVKIELKFNALPEVEDATITFATKQLRLTAEDPDALIPRLTEIARTVEHEAVILPWERAVHHDHHDHHAGCACGHDHHNHHEDCSCGHDHHEHHTGCSCGHDHHEHHAGCACGHDHHDHQGGCACGHDHHDHHSADESPLPLFLGAGAFAVGLALDFLNLGLLAKVVFLGAYLALGLPVLNTAWKNLTKGNMLDENFLMSIATLGAFCINEFPEAVGVMLFYRVGEYFEHRAVERSRSQIMKAVDLRPETVMKVHGSMAQTIPAAQARVGDVVLVRPGDRIPLDAVVVTGESRIDTAPITGEPVPVSVKPGDSVISGCINLSGQLTVRVEKPLSESMVTRILDSVENAAASKPKIDRFITRFARIYTPAVVAVAAATALIPSLVTGDWSHWVYTALSFLVMSCPCALVLSVPLAFFSGIGVGSRKGILFKGGASMEALAAVKAVALDKTGTVTKGDFSVQHVDGGDELLALCAACEAHSTHPIAVSIVTAAREKHLPLAPVARMEELAGRGVRALMDGKTVLCGNAALLEENGISFELPQTQGTLVLVAVDGVYRGHLVISDTLKPGAAGMTARLENMGIATAMLTGDSQASAEAVAQAANIREVHAKLLPQDKLEILRQIRSRHGATMFVGDGINDAPVLAGADVGAAMGTGADAAIEAADVVFMTGDPSAIAESIAIARSTQAIAWQNVVFALGIKAAVMALGLLGYANMWLAVFADSGVAMLCVLNSIRALYRKH